MENGAVVYYKKKWPFTFSVASPQPRFKPNLCMAERNTHHRIVDKRHYNVK